jgi:hypothetical protein
MKEEQHCDALKIRWNPSRLRTYILLLMEYNNSKVFGKADPWATFSNKSMPLATLLSEYAAHGSCYKRTLAGDSLVRSSTTNISAAWSCPTRITGPARGVCGTKFRAGDYAQRIVDSAAKKSRDSAPRTQEKFRGSRDTDAADRRKNDESGAPRRPALATPWCISIRSTKPDDRHGLRAFFISKLQK